MRIRRTMAAHHLLSSGGRMVVGVSGGADSVALLRVLTLVRPSGPRLLRVAHLDHGLRPGSGDDAEFVRELTARWRIPATVERRAVGTVCAREGWSLEEGARRVRYRFLLEVARRFGAVSIALAHTADDQAETVLMRLVRGTGLTGLCGIPVKRPLEEVWVVRPFLWVWRREILEFLSSERIPYREDATNQDERFLRNRIRHELLPLLERRYNPNIKAGLLQVAQQSASDYAYLQEAAERQWKRLVKPGSRNGSGQADLSLAVSPFLRQPKALQRQLLRRAIERVRGDLNQFEYRHWLEAEHLLTERPIGAVLDLPGGVQFRRERERVVCSRTRPHPAVSVT